MKKITYPVAISLPELKDGEQLLVSLVTGDGSRHEHVILMPQHFGESMNWQDAMACAKETDAELIDRVEGAIAFATARDKFKPDWYWTREQHAGYDAVAWCQDFSDGGQNLTRKVYECLVVLVRRVAI